MHLIMLHILYIVDVFLKQCRCVHINIYLYNFIYSFISATQLTRLTRLSVCISFLSQNKNLIRNHYHTTSSKIRNPK